MPKVTEHFSSEEFAQPAKRGCPAEPYPEGWVQERLLPLCETLEALRASLGKPIRIISGYRSQAYNAAVYRGAGKPPTDSQHSYGRAADIVIDGVAPAEVHKRMLELRAAGKMPHLGGLGLYSGFCHLDVRPPKRPGHLAQWSDGRTLEQTA